MKEGKGVINVWKKMPESVCFNGTTSNIRYHISYPFWLIK